MHRRLALGARMQTVGLHCLHLHVVVALARELPVLHERGERVADAAVLGFPADKRSGIRESERAVGPADEDFVAELRADWPRWKWGLSLGGLGLVDQHALSVDVHE